MDWGSFFKEHRSNLFFWTLGGGSVFGAIGHAIANDIHGHPTDWTLFCLFLAVGLVFIYFALRGEKRRATPYAGVPLEIARDAQTLTQPDSSVELANRSIVFSEPWQKVDYLTAHDRGMRWITMLSDTQLDLIETARDLTGYLNSLGEYPECPEPKTSTSFIEHIISGPGGQWSTRFTAGYEKDFAPRINTLILYLEQLDGQRREALRRYKDTVSQMSDLWKVRELLWIEASHLSGIELRSQRES